MTVTLTEWLRAQLDEDAAGAADPFADTAWHARGCENLPDVLYPGYESGPCDCGVPARVLREIEAKRGVLRQYEAVREQVRNPVSAENRRAARIAQGELEDVLRLLAVPYSDRPGYDGAWRP